ncbi:30S ribosomal protein S14 [Candidatus Nasuia deltocephalinicola]|uniref:Small ribosomal subunit protein uS14 n=1 Tax=Candidatus Nasuia deltocephalincola TaxID=1160784 RepID=A0A974WKJ0_9PROT|nr:30S ribosomal protein S14 [Candidatus Nasuia deltocephalinicola]
MLYSIQKLPKNSSPTRIKNRCCLTGRPRGVFRMFGLSRIIVRKFSSKGYIPGLLKNSW